MRTDDNEENTDNGETPGRPDDVLASTAEVDQAMIGLYRNVSMKKRLVAIAALILQGKPQLRWQYQPEDLLQEALERIGIGKRTWPKNRLDFPGLVIGVMRSWSSSLEKTKSTQENLVVMEHEFVSGKESDGALNLEEVAADEDTPLEHLEAKELDAHEQSLLTILKAQYEYGALEAKILDAISNTAFETHEEIRLALGVKEADYRNAWKVLMRAAKKLESKE